MAPINFNLTSTFDLIVGVMMLFTASPVPIVFAEIHAFFLIFKGTVTQIRGFPPMMPIFILGTVADIISAAIIYTGQPPIFADYKVWIAGFLAFKGFSSLLGIMSMS